jgi:hypothetical protein
MWTAPFSNWTPDLGAFFTWGPSSAGALITFLLMMAIYVCYHVWVIWYEDREYRRVVDRLRRNQGGAAVRDRSEG